MSLDLTRLRAIATSSEGELVTTAGIHWYPSVELSELVGEVEALRVYIKDRETAATAADDKIAKLEATLDVHARVAFHIGQSLGNAVEGDHTELPAQVDTLVRHKATLKARIAELNGEIDRLKAAASLRVSA